MEVTYQLLESEFDQNVFKSIKAAFKNRLIKISVSNSDMKNVVAEKEYEYGVSIPFNDLSNIIESFEKDDSYKLMDALENFKIAAK